LVLDSEGLSGWLTDDARVMACLAAAHRRGAEVTASAMTILEATQRSTKRARLDWVLSMVRVEPVTKASARAAAARLIGRNLHGHAHAIDAAVAEMASRQPRPVAVLTSDPGDLRRLCDEHVRVVAL
jgi:hypothetical protein